jgi:chorismate dehydratase
VSPFAALHGLRVGCVQYLNAKPLIDPYDGEVTFEHPARLADMFAAGKIDVALIPAFEALRQPDFPIVDGVAIASRGAVYSVFLAYSESLADVRTVAVDPASRTSSNMLRCLLAEFHGLHPAFKFAEEGAVEPGRGLLLIGNQAIRYREHRRDDIEILDLGQEWLTHTGLPFVYAVWQIRPEIADCIGVAGALRAIKCAGLARVREIARLQREFDPAFAERYLTTHIRFDMGAEEKEGLARFRGLLEKHGLIGSSKAGLRFV